jgi:hypothetical protein
MDDIERHFPNVKFCKPNQPLNKTDHGTEVLDISGGTIK